MTRLFRLQNWTAKRSGARMTISAKLPDGQEVRFQADAIEVRPGGTILIDRKSGTTTRLELLSDD